MVVVEYPADSQSPSAEVPVVGAVVAVQALEGAWQQFRQ